MRLKNFIRIFLGIYATIEALLILGLTLGEPVHIATFLLLVGVAGPLATAIISFVGFAGVAALTEAFPERDENGKRIRS